MQKTFLTGVVILLIFCSHATATERGTGRDKHFYATTEQPEDSPKRGDGRSK